MKHSILVFLSAILIVGCGADDNQVPPGAALKITPEEKVWEVEANYQVNSSGEVVCVPISDYYMDHLITISLTDGESRPIGKSKVTIDLSHAANTSSGFIPTVELYDDDNGDYLPDETELVSAEGKGFYETRTDKYSGTISLILRVYLSCDFKAQLYVRAGTASSTANIEVVNVADLPQVDEDGSDNDE